MKKKIIVSMILFTSLVGCVGCSLKSEKTSTTTKNTTTEDVVNHFDGNNYRISTECTEDEGDTPIINTNAHNEILMAGNSLFNKPMTDKAFENLISRYGKDANLTAELWDGMNINAQYRMLQEDTDHIREDYKNADVIIFQEYGNHYDTTYQDICNIIDQYCKEGVVVYYYTTDFDSKGEYLDRIKEDKRMHIIDFGTVMFRLCGTQIILNGNPDMANDYLYYKNDFHPNQLCGLFAAAYIYKQIYKAEFNDYSFDQLDNTLKGLIPGVNDSEKNKNYDNLIDVLNKGVLGV